ncbi:MAG: hypothetical protein JWQ87_2253 [Candidatus Sulfotelmatobacter sp.]|nr:hypothetical protein [Candidatus Sulfotelmatobacter sp.]
MPIATGIALGLGAMAAAGSVGGAAISANAAGNAANTQASAAQQAQQLQADEAQKSLDFQKQQWDTQQQNMAPWLSAGKSALGQLNGLMSTPGQGLLTPWTEQFQAPTSVTEQNDPGYQFRLQQGEAAMQNSAAANGSLESGNTAQALNNYAQNSASNEYSNVYNRALQDYGLRFNTFETNQANEYNHLAGLSGTGQTAATTLGQQGQAAANNIGNINLTTGAQQGQDMNNAAAAMASGYIGGANAWSGALGGATNNLTSMMLMQQMFGKTGSGAGGGSGDYASTGGW